MHSIPIRKFLVGFAMWAFVVFIPAHISFAYSMYPQYQLYWCSSYGGGYYSYSPCPQQYSYTYPSYYYTYPTYSYYYPYYYYTYTYPSYTYASAMNTNTNYNYNYVGGWW